MSERQPASTMNYKEVLAELEEVYQNAKPYMLSLIHIFPIALWAAGFITQPVMAIITVILSVLILTMTCLLYTSRCV